MTRSLLNAFVCLTFAATFAFAQHTPPTPQQIVQQKVSRLTTLLTLNTTQVQDATNIFTTEETALSGLAASMKSARTALQTAITANDTAGIATAANTIGSLTAQQVTATATANAAFYAILNPTQQAQYSKLGGLNAGGRGGFGPRGRPY